MAATLLAVLVASGLAWAQTTGTMITVNTTADESNTDGDCSLREAIQAANGNTAVDACPVGSGTEEDLIVFAVGSPATITLYSALPITDGAGLVIYGGRAHITINGNDTQRMAFVASGAKLAVHKLTLDGRTNLSSNVGIENSGTLTITNSTFSGNSSDGGGGIHAQFGTPVTLINSTFSANSASDSGGGIHNVGGNFTILNSTFSGNSAQNSGGGIINDVGTVTLGSTILSDSTSGGNCSGAITDGGYNIDDGTTCAFSADNDSLPDTDPRLASTLAYNGGPTKTIALLRGSPALNAIPEAVNGCATEITTEQRGLKRPQGTKCDIGAFEKKVRRR